MDMLDKQAVDVVADLYRHVLTETKMSHQEVSRLVTYLITLFFAEKTHLGDDWERVGVAFSSRDSTMFETIASPIPALAGLEVKVPELSEAVWSIIDSSREVAWDKVSPLVFGSAFQGVLEMDTKEATEELSHGGGKRREFGAHYTSEKNILRVIKPLFLDSLSAEVESSPSIQLHEKISTLTFLDPAVGCASFLVVIYRELRKLEHNLAGSIGDSVHQVSLSQMYGIEINPEAALVAHLALGIIEHQMNVETGRKSHSAANITVANALQSEWREVLEPTRCSFIVGNPPFRGALKMTKSQKSDMKVIGSEYNVKAWASLDLAAAWFIKSADYLGNSVSSNGGLFDLFSDTERGSAKTVVALVSTNSVSQGLHIPNLWSWMFDHDIEIGFAYPSFRWDNEAGAHAAVTVVIIGFSVKGNFTSKFLFHGDDAERVEYINGGLTSLRVGAVEPVRGRVLSVGIPNAELGNLPRGKGFVVSAEDRQREVIRNPELSGWIKPFVGADELTKGGEQYCLWLVDAPQSVLDDDFISARVEDIRRQRLESTKKETRDAAVTSELFDEIRQPVKNYLAIPTSSSGNRKYIPLKFLPSSTIASNALKTVTGATPFHFAVLSSAMHMAWMRNTSARLGAGNDYSYSVASTYNTFPWLDADEWTTAAISALGSEILAVRERHNIALGKMYTNMPEDLIEAHDKLNALLDVSYGYSGDGSDDSRFEFLYALYKTL